MTPETAPPRGRGHYDRRATPSERARQAREAILGAVRALLLEGRDTVFAVADVIRLTGVGRNTFYGHFRDLEEAVAVVVEECRREVEAALSMNGVEDTPHAAVHGFVRSWVELAAKRPATVRIAAQLDTEVLVEALEERLRALHALGARAGIFRRDLEVERQLALGNALLALAVAVARGQAGVEPSVAAGQDAVLALCR